MHQLHQAIFLQCQEADCLQLEAGCLEVEGLPASGVCGGMDRRLRAYTWPPPRGHDLARSFHACWPGLCPRGTGRCLPQWSQPNQPKNPKLQPQTHWLKSSKWGMSENGAPSYQLSSTKGGHYTYQNGTFPCINMGDTKWIYNCYQVEGCPEEPSTSCTLPYAPMCALSPLGQEAIMCPSSPSTFFNTDALRQHGKPDTSVWVFKLNLKNVCTCMSIKK